MRRCFTVPHVAPRYHTFDGSSSHSNLLTLFVIYLLPHSSTFLSCFLIDNALPPPSSNWPPVNDRSFPSDPLPHPLLVTFILHHSSICLSCFLITYYSTLPSHVASWQHGFNLSTTTHSFHSPFFLLLCPPMRHHFAAPPHVISRCHTSDWPVSVHYLFDPPQ